jgi:hypothetical protein
MCVRRSTFTDRGDYMLLLALDCLRATVLRTRPIDRSINRLSIVREKEFNRQQPQQLCFSDEAKHLHSLLSIYSSHEPFLSFLSFLLLPLLVDIIIDHRLWTTTCWGHSQPSIGLRFSSLTPSCRFLHCVPYYKKNFRTKI